MRQRYVNVPLTSHKVARANDKSILARSGNLLAPRELSCNYKMTAMHLDPSRMLISTQYLFLLGFGTDPNKCHIITNSIEFNECDNMTFLPHRPALL